MSFRIQIFIQSTGILRIWRCGAPVTGLEVGSIPSYAAMSKQQKKKKEDKPPREFVASKRIKAAHRKSDEKVPLRKFVRVILRPGSGESTELKDTATAWARNKGLNI